MKPPKKSVIVTARIAPVLSKKLEKYARAAGHTKSWAVEDLIARHVDYETWFVQQVQEGLAAARRGELVLHDDARRRVRVHMAAGKRTRRQAA